MRYLMAAALAATTALAGATFATTASAQGGSYTSSCRNVSSNGGSLSAECADASGRYRQTTIQASQCQGDIGNNNGVLQCNGAQGTAGSYVGDNRGGYDRGGYDRGRSNNTAGAAVAGVIAGALGANLYQQGYSYPTYGDPRYGDPRYDPRFTDGGWGYGSRGQWVSISRRADWFDRRIDQGVRNGQLSRREAQDLRYQLDRIVDMERDYGRNGFSNWERADLDRRFDELAARIRFERRDYDNRPGYGGGYNNGGYNNGGYSGYGGYNR